MKTIKVTTPVGEFTRKTSTDCTHAVVRRSENARAAYERFLSTGKRSPLSTDNRWIKDRGFVVSYHSSERAARAAAQQTYQWDKNAEVIGIYEVTI
jgi:hypothetical protein